MKLVAGPRETHGRRDTLLATTRGDHRKLLREPWHGFLSDAEVVAGVVANLKAVAVQFGDLPPSEVIFFVRRKREALRDEKRGAEAVAFQHGPGDGVVRGGGVIEGEDDEFVRHRRCGRHDRTEKREQTDGGNERCERASGGVKHGGMLVRLRAGKRAGAQRQR